MATKKKTASRGKTGKKPAGKKKGKKNNQNIEIELAALAYITLALVLFFIFLLFSPDLPVENAGVGVLGIYIAKGFAYLFGSGRFTLPFVFLVAGVLYVKEEEEDFAFMRRSVFLIVFFFVLLALLNIGQTMDSFRSYLQAAAGAGGGVVGGFFAFFFLYAFGKVIAIILLSCLLLVSLVAVTGLSFFGVVKKTGRAAGETSKQLAAKRQEYKERREKEEAERLENAEEWPLEEDLPRERIIRIPEEEGTLREEFDMALPTFRQHLADLEERADFAPVVEEGEPDMGLKGSPVGIPKTDVVESLPFIPRDFKKPRIKTEAVVETEGESAEIPEMTVTKEPKKTEEAPEYTLPSTKILNKGERINNKRITKNINDSVDILERTLASFGVSAKVTEVSYGPSITRFEVQPAAGVKVSKIVGLADDIALQLAAADIRMEAPVPGKSVIGIEVPRSEKSTVGFRDILENSRFFEIPSKLTCAFGKDITGNSVIGDLGAMPHLLIAGATGSGKSVCMNTIICSILFKAKPDEVKFIMIDPKRVELANYEGLPHLIAPVVTDPKKAAGSLKWALREMENRYTIFHSNRVKDLASYNNLVKDEVDRLPQIVVFIDELADLMMVAAKDVEDAICRLAQMARAAGIHLVIATQRPSVDVITGLIKANIPSRIAFAVSSQMDSRTILDMGGAEKLLGRGDMLYHPVGMAKPLRVQGAFLSDGEAEALLAHCKNMGKPSYIEGVAQPIETAAPPEEEDELFFDAAKMVINAGQASASMLQKRFRIGYNRASRLMDSLMEQGIVGPADGARPRVILISMEAFLQRFEVRETPGEEQRFDF